MVIVSKFSNSPDELSENDELREFELSGSDCISTHMYFGLRKFSPIFFFFAKSL